MKWRVGLIMAALVIMGVGWLLPPSASALSFFKELVSGEAIPNAELKIDSQGNLHAVFLDRITKEIKYAVKTQNSWVIETVGAGVSAQWVALALDGQDYAHIAFYDYVNHQVKYATNIGGGWDIITVAAANDSRCRIAAYGLGQIYLAFNSGADSQNPGRMYLALIDAIGGVNIEEINPGSDAGYSPSLALDKAGRPHLTYFDRELEQLKYAFKSNGSWQISIVDSAPLTGWQSALALDARGWPHIAYYDLLGAGLKYAYKNYDNWNLSTIGSSGQVGQYPALGFDPKGRVLIAYYDFGGGDLKLAYREGPGWIKAAVVQAGEGGEHISLAVNAWGEACLLYYDYNSVTANTELYYGVVTLPRVYLTSPRGREVWRGGRPRTISWRANSPEILSYTIQYATDFIWVTVADHLPAEQREYSWMVVRPRSVKKCSVRILGLGAGGKILAADQSPYFFLTP